MPVILDHLRFWYFWIFKRFLLNISCASGDSALHAVKTSVNAIAAFIECVHITCHSEHLQLNTAVTDLKVLIAVNQLGFVESLLDTIFLLRIS